MLSTKSGVSVTSVGVAMFTFGLTVFTVTLGWTISSALLVIIGVDDTGRKEVLGVLDGHRESEASWTGAH